MRRRSHTSSRARRAIPTSLTSTEKPLQPQRHLAFTLVELLVVIGVIAVLLGFTMPALGRARRQAECAACLSNLRQLSAAFLMYSSDNCGRFPRPSQNVVLMPEDWIHYQTNVGRDPSNSTIARYLTRGTFDPRVLRCPADDISTHCFFKPNFWPFGVRYDYSYSVNENICRINPWPMLKVTQIHNVAEKILIVDESSTTIDDGCWAWQPNFGVDGNVVSIRHDQRCEQEKNYFVGRGNVAFADGHAATIERKETFEQRRYDPKFGDGITRAGH